MSVETPRTAPEPDSTQEMAAPAPTTGAAPSALSRFVGGSATRNLGLVIALVLLFIVGVITAGDRFGSPDNALTILRAAAVIGVASIGAAVGGVTDRRHRKKGRQQEWRRGAEDRGHEGRLR